MGLINEKQLTTIEKDIQYASRIVIQPERRKLEELLSEERIEKLIAIFADLDLTPPLSVTGDNLESIIEIIKEVKRGKLSHGGWRKDFPDASPYAGDCKYFKNNAVTAVGSSVERLPSDQVEIIGEENSMNENNEGENIRSPEERKWIKMLRTERASENGIVLLHFFRDKEYYTTEKLAQALVGGKLAVYLTPEEVMTKEKEETHVIAVGNT